MNTKLIASALIVASAAFASSAFAAAEYPGQSASVSAQHAVGYRTNGFGSAGGVATGSSGSGQRAQAADFGGLYSHS